MFEFWPKFETTQKLGVSMKSHLNTQKFTLPQLFLAFALGAAIIGAIAFSAVRYPTLINIPGISYTTPVLRIGDFVVSDKCTGNGDALLAANFTSIQPVYRCQEIIRTKDGGVELEVYWDKPTIGLPYLEGMWSGAIIPLDPPLEPGEYSLQLYGDDNAYIELMDENLHPDYRDSAVWDNGPKSAVFVIDVPILWIKISHQDKEGHSEYRFEIERLKPKEITD